MHYKAARRQLHDSSSSSRSSANYIISCYNNDAAHYRWRSAPIKRGVRRYVRKQIIDTRELASSIFATLCKKLFKFQPAPGCVKQKIIFDQISRVLQRRCNLVNLSRFFLPGEAFFVEASSRRDLQKYRSATKRSCYVSCISCNHSRTSRTLPRKRKRDHENKRHVET
jgi:hypothetical protein